ncbi:hypothetical protein DL770_003874 [Monosporascus sp. CRB-9-2]|nr:hypothetical protein DL770_003874 [Monosporascus sp. CRB-9-2]
MEQDDGVAIFKPVKDFLLNFSLKQQIHTVRRKLRRAHAILCNTLKTLSRIGAHENALAVTSTIAPSTHVDFQQELHNLPMDIENYKQTVQKLLSVSKDTRLVYDDILKLYGQELLH